MFTGPLRAKPGPGTKIKTGPHCKNDENNGLPKMIKRMIRQNIHFDISKSINNQKKVNDTLERWIHSQGRSHPKVSGGGGNTS